MGELHYITEAKKLRQHTHALECNARAIKIMRARIARLRAGQQSSSTLELIREATFYIRILERSREYL